MAMAIVDDMLSVDDIAWGRNPISLALARGFDVDAERRDCRRWLFTVSLPSHAMVDVWSMRPWESARLPKKEGEAQTPRIAPKG
jgi:hypothetical protein